MVPGWDAEVLADLPQEVALTITSARAPVHETGLYSEVEPVRRMVFLPPGGPPEMLDQSCAFLLTAKGWSVGCPPSTLKVYVAAISAYHGPRRGEVGGEARSGCQVS